MKVKTISRVEADFTAEVAGDKLKVFRNYDPALHPLERPREYTRALNAVKLDRLFAKPFVGALDGHCDSVSALATSPSSLVAFVSGAADGEIRVWDLPRRKCVWSVYGHRGSVRGLAVSPSGGHFFSCSEDKTVKQWSLHVKDEEDDIPSVRFARWQSMMSRLTFLGLSCSRLPHSRPRSPSCTFCCMDTSFISLVYGGLEMARLVLTCRLWIGWMRLPGESTTTGARACSRRARPRCRCGTRAGRSRPTSSRGEPTRSRACGSTRPRPRCSRPRARTAPSRCTTPAWPRQCARSCSRCVTHSVLFSFCCLWALANK